MDSRPVGNRMKKPSNGIWASADQGHSGGQYGLGEMYAKGEGVEKDESLAVEYFVLAADNGHAQSQRVLINAYEKGLLGLTVDLGKGGCLAASVSTYNSRRQVRM